VATRPRRGGEIRELGGPSVARQTTEIARGDEGKEEVGVSSALTTRGRAESSAWTFP